MIENNDNLLVDFETAVTELTPTLYRRGTSIKA